MASIRISKDTAEKLDQIMIELEIPSTKRAEAYRLAFAKGIDSKRSINPNIEMGDMYEFKSGIMYKHFDETVIKHLVINKMKEPIDQYDFNKLILSLITNGVDEMYEELQKLTNADNYLLYLFDKHQKKTV